MLPKGGGGGEETTAGLQRGGGIFRMPDRPFPSTFALAARAGAGRPFLANFLPRPPPPPPAALPCPAPAANRLPGRATPPERSSGRSPYRVIQWPTAAGDLLGGLLVASLCSQSDSPPAASPRQAAAGG